MGSKINKNKQKPSVSMWFLFSATLIVLIFFLWYFLIYVSGNEKLLIQKSFRVLNQVGENFKGRENSYRNLSQSKDMKNKLSSGDWFGSWSSFDEAKSSMKTYYSNLEIDKDTLNKDYFYFSNNHKFISDRLFTDEDIILDIYFKINKKNFFEPLERKDVFEEIIIIKENSKINSKSVIYGHEFIYSSFMGGIDVKNLDSLILSSEGFSSGIVKDIKLSGVDYVLFMTKIQLLNNESYYIGGIINKDNYVSQTRSINAYVALMLLIFFFIFLFSIPLIKLRLISENQQLKIGNLASSFISVIFGVFFTLLVLLSLFSNYQREENVNNSLEYLSDSIRDTLVSEITQIDNTLNLFMEVAREQNINNNEIILNVNDTIGTFDLKKLSYKYFKLIFDLDSIGQQKTVTSSRKKRPSWDNYSFRRYFRESGEWNLDNLQIMLDFIVSNTSGEKLGVVSKRKKDFIYVITSRLYSVINTILPAGYGFCVIDNNGDVKFHSNSERMLQENFIEETENSGDLKQAIYGNLSAHFSASYIGKNHQCYVQPLNSLPLYLVTFYDQSFLNSVNLKTTNLTFLFSLLALIIFFLIVVGSRVVIYKRSELNRGNDVFDWLKPNKRKIEKSKCIYLANIIAIALMITACIISNPETVIIIIFLFLVTQIATTYWYMNFISWDHFRKNYFMGLLFPSIIIIYILFYLAYIVLPESTFHHIFIYNSILIITNLIVIKFGHRIYLGFKDHTHFYLYFYSWLALIVIVPVFIFFITFYNHEAKSDIAHKLYTYAKKETKRNYDIDKFYDSSVQLPFHKYKNSLKEKGVYFLNEFKRVDSLEFHKLQEISVEETLGKILFHLKPDLDSQSRERKSLVNKLPGYVIKSAKYPNSVIKEDSDSSFTIYPSSVFIKYPAEQIHSSDTLSNKMAYYRGEIDTFGFGKIQRWITFISILLFICYFIFRILKFVTDKVPSSSIGLFLVKKRFCDVISEHINSRNNLMIQFASAREKNEYEKKKGKENYFSNIAYKLVEYKEIKEFQLNSIKNSTERLIIQNVHVDYNNLQEECEKLNIVNNIAEKGNIHLILIINHSFAKIIDRIKHLIGMEEDKKQLKQLQSLQKILEITNHKFIHLFPPLTEKELEVEDEEVFERKSTLEQLKSVINNELGVSDFLKEKYEKSIINYASVIVESEVTNPIEKIILKTQQYAIGYYDSIWEACSDNEKILLYDIADDMLLNDKNKKVIKILINKGLLKYNGYIDIMNKSFRNFIVTKFESEYEQEYIQKYETSGKWANYRAPILLVVLALAFFIALQENILTNLTSILPAIIAALGLITKVSGIFSKGNSAGATSKPGH